jgi:hypothetical protein
MCEGKGGIELKTYPIGVDIVEVTRAPCHVSDSRKVSLYLYLGRIARFF